LFGERWNYMNDVGQLILLEDGRFRGLELELQLADRSRTFSLVDRVLRAMILSEERFFDVFLTYNTPDFIDACQIRNIPLINESISPEHYEL
jgi:hypothetical protein